MDTVDSIFAGKISNENALMEYGFTNKTYSFKYTTLLPECGLVLTVTVSENALDANGKPEISVGLNDPDTGEPYVLHMVSSATGSYVGKVRRETELILRDISEKCFISPHFDDLYVAELEKYIFENYGEKTEYPWKDGKENGIWRRDDNRKWYGAILTVSQSKLRLEGNVKIRVLNLKAAPSDVEKLLDRPGFFPAYHMNKKHWFSVLTDGTVSYEELCSLTDTSRTLAGNNKTIKEKSKNG